MVSLLVGKGHGIGWKPLFSAEKLCIRSGHCSGRLPRCCPDCRDHGGSYQAVCRRQEGKEKPNSAHHPLGSILVLKTISSSSCSQLYSTMTVKLMFISSSHNCRISFGLAEILMATGSSMNDRQPYGRGWTNGECYTVKDGVFIGSAVLAAATVIFIIGFMFTTTEERMHQRRTGPGPDEERNQTTEQQTKQADSGRQ